MLWYSQMLCCCSHYVQPVTYLLHQSASKKNVSVPYRILHNAPAGRHFITKTYISVIKIFCTKKLGRRRNVAPYKNCNQFFDVDPIICNSALKVNPIQNFQEIFKRIIFACTMTHVLLFLQIHNLFLSSHCL